MNEPLDLSNLNNDKETKSRVTKLQEKLYSPNTQFQIRTRQNLKREVKDVPDSWGDLEKDSFSKTVGSKKMSFFTKIFIFAFIFFIGSLGFAFYKFSGNSTAVYSNTVDVSVVGPVAVGGGEEMSLDIIIQNKNPFAIQTVDIVLEFPEGTKTVDQSSDLPRIREGLGDIPANSIVKKTYSATLFGQEGDQKSIEVRAEYRMPNSNAIFENKKTFMLALQSAPVRIIVDTVKEITSGQALSFDVTVSSNSNSNLENILVTAEYPFGFNFSQSTLQPSSGNNIWYIEKLSPQESKTFTVRGSLIGQNNEERVFKWNVGLSENSESKDFKAKFTTLPKSISLIKPFLALDLSIDGDFGVDIVKTSSDRIGGRLTYKNNTGGTIVDPAIVLKINGEVLDDNSVEVSGGFFNSSDNTISWNKVTKADTFTEIPAGFTETLLFSFKTKALATRQAVYKNPELIVDATITGKRVAENNVSENIKVDSEKRIKIQSGIELKAITSYEAGPIPPKIGQDTTYTVTLNLSNTSNLIERSKVRMTLPPYVRWNNVTSPSNESVVYEPSSRVIEWDLGDVKEHVGFIDPARFVAIQLTLNPSTSQNGQTPSLLIEPVFTGFDTFTQTDIKQDVKEIPTTDMGNLSDLENAKVVP